MKNLRITQDELRFIINELYDHYEQLMWDKLRLEAEHPKLKDLDVYLNEITEEQVKLSKIISKLYDGLLWEE